MGRADRFRDVPVRVIGGRDAPTPAYVLGGHEAALAVVRSLGRAAIPVVVVVSSPHEHARRSRYARAVVETPDPADHPREYVDLLLGLARVHGRGMVVPTTDESLEAVARHRDELAARHIVACPTHAVAQRFLDKRVTSEIAAAVGVDAPRTSTPGSEAELEEHAGELAFPCLVKPRESYRYNRAFGVKMTRVEDRQQLREAWRRAHALGIGVLVQELIPGPETGGVNYNVHLVDGEPVAELTSRKMRLAPPDFGFPSAVVSGPVPEVIGPGRRILGGMGIANGFANVEFKQDERDGRYKLMEVNGRPNMSGALAVRCGVDFPLIGYRHLTSGQVPLTPAWGSGVYWANEFADLQVVAQRWRAGELSLRTGFAPYVSRHVFASFALRDPGPFLSRVRTKLSGDAGRASARSRTGSG